MSPDGYVRLRLANLNLLPLVHLYSENDDEFLQELQAQTVPARAAGFSEWKSVSDPVISLGWSWFIHNHSERMMLAPDAVRSNVMLIDTFGYDLGPQKTSSLLFSWLGGFEWTKDVMMALRGNIPAC